MSRTKQWLEQEQQKFAERKLIKDGCPPEEATKENWDTMVEALYDGDYDAAWDEFQHSIE